MYLREIIGKKEIICKGYQKRLLLQKFLKIDDVTNIDEIGCPSLKIMDWNHFPYCSLYARDGVFSLNNADKILNFYTNENY